VNRCAASLMLTPRAGSRARGRSSGGWPHDVGFEWPRPGSTPRTHSRRGQTAIPAGDRRTRQEVVLRVGDFSPTGARAVSVGAVQLAPGFSEAPLSAGERRLRTGASRCDAGGDVSPQRPGPERRGPARKISTGRTAAGGEIGGSSKRGQEYTRNCAARPCRVMKQEMGADDAGIMTRTYRS
jgi:hypothetical protein